MYKETIVDLINQQKNDKSFNIALEQKCNKIYLTKDLTESQFKYVSKHISDLFIFMNQDSIKVIEEIKFRLNKYYTYCYKIQIEEDSYKIYPLSLSTNVLRNLWEEEVKYILESYLKEEISLMDLFIKRKNYYENQLQKIKQSVLQNPMKPYYGDAEFMYGRAKYILECAAVIFPRKEMDSIVKNMEVFVKTYVKPVDSLDEKYFKNFYRDYLEFEHNYQKMLAFENKLSLLIVERWKAYLTDPKSHNNHQFKYLAHAFTNGFIDPNQISKVCCFLATENILTTIGTEGLLFDIDLDSLEMMSFKDAGSFRITKKDFVEEGFLNNRQLPNPSQEGIFFEESQISKLILPEVLEREVIKQNLQRNGEILNYQIECLYSEILLNNKAKAIGVFYTDESNRIEEIKSYASKYQLPLVHLSLKQLRKNRCEEAIKRG